jgi:hypothetical protein
MKKIFFTLFVILSLAGVASFGFQSVTAQTCPNLNNSALSEAVENTLNTSQLCRMDGMGHLGLGIFFAAVIVVYVCVSLLLLRLLGLKIVDPKK